MGAGRNAPLLRWIEGAKGILYTIISMIFSLGEYLNSLTNVINNKKIVPLDK